MKPILSSVNPAEKNFFLLKKKPNYTMMDMLNCLKNAMNVFLCKKIQFLNMNQYQMRIQDYNITIKPYICIHSPTPSDK